MGVRNAFFFFGNFGEQAMNRILLIVLVTCATLSLRAQDSLMRALESAPLDTHRVILLNDIGWEVMFEQPARAVPYYQEAIRLAEALDYNTGLAQAYNNFGILEELRAEYATAERYYRKALRLRRALGDRAGVAVVYHNLGNLYNAAQQYAESIKAYEAALDIRVALADTMRMATGYYNIGVVQQHIGNYPLALEHLLEYLTIMEQVGDEEGIAAAYNEIGNVQFELEKFEEAKQYYRQSLTLRQALEDPGELADSYNNLGIVADEEKQYEKALDYYRQSLGLAQQLQDDVRIARAYNNIGYSYKKLDQFVEAERYLDLSLELRKQQEDREGIMEIYNSLGDIRRQQERYREALQYTRLSLEIAQSLDHAKFIEKAYKDFAKIYELQGDFAKAYRYYKQYANLKDDRFNTSEAEKLAQMQVLYETNKIEQQVAERDRDLALRQAELNTARTVQLSLAIGGVLLLALLGLLGVAYRQRSRINKQLATTNEAIEHERRRSDTLLHNILPAATATELKDTGRYRARAYDSVTVLFADFVHFTNIAEQLTPARLVDFLDECFQAFDAIVERHGVEKIKTIGDAYMCAGGIPTPSSTHALSVVRAALDMQAYMHDRVPELRAAGIPFFGLRIGIHTGEVVAGVVGMRKFAYDIWGDAVNIAARMESSGAAYRINVSQPTYELIKDHYHCSYRGKIPAKNKGDIDMYFVEGART